MNVVELLHPLIDDCRNQIGDESLVLALQMIQIDDNRSSIEKAIKCEFGEKLLPVSRIICGRKVVAFCKQILHTISEPCINIEHLLQTMQSIDNHLQYRFDYSISRAWKCTTIKLSTLIEIECKNGEIISDKELLHFIAQALLIHIGKEALINAIANVIFPIAICGKIFILCESNCDNNLSLDIRLFDEDGWKVAELLSVLLLDEGSSMRNGYYPLGTSSGEVQDIGVSAELIPSTCDNDKLIKTATEQKEDMRTTVLIPSVFNAEKSSPHADKISSSDKILDEIDAVLRNEHITNYEGRRLNLSQSNKSDLHNVVDLDAKSANVICHNDGIEKDLLLRKDATYAGNNEIRRYDHVGNCLNIGYHKENKTLCEGQEEPRIIFRQSVPKVSFRQGNDNEIRIRIRRILSKFTSAKCNDDRTFMWHGLDSLKLATFENELKDEFASVFNVPYGCTFHHNTISTLSNYFEALTKMKRSIIDINNRPDYDQINNRPDYDQIDRELRKSILDDGSIPLSTAQNRLIFMAKYEPENDQQFIEKIVVKVANIHIRRLAIALNKLVAHQNILRTIYTVSAQQILSLSESYFAIRIYNEKTKENNLYMNIFAAPPLRVYLKKINIDYCLELQQHHISTDGFSIGLLMRELRMLYSGETLNKLTFNYAHFAIFERKYLLNEIYIRNRQSYWIKKFQNFHSEKLFTDKIKKPIQTYKGQTIEYKFNETDIQMLHYLAEFFSVTEFTLILTFYHLLISISFKLNDFCTGISIAERYDKQLQSLAGCLVNIVPIRLEIDPSKPISEIITKMANIINESIHNQLPFDYLLKLFPIERDISTSPLFQIFFIMDVVDVFQDQEHSSSNDGILDGVILEQESRFAKYDQVWYFIRNSQNLKLKIEYNIDLFYRNSIEKILNEFLRLIRIIGERPTAEISTIDIQANVEKFHLYEMNANNRKDFPTFRTPMEIITAQNHMNVYCNRLISRKISFSNIFIERRSNQNALAIRQYFLQHWGEYQRADSIFAILTHRTPQLILTVFALWKCGFAIAPLCVDWPKQKIYSILKSLPYPSIITSEEFLDNEDLQMECLCINITKLFDHSCSYSPSPMRRSLQLSDLAYITYTSGSTGPPKGVCTELLGLNNLAINYTKNLAMNRWSSVYQVVNHSFDIFFADLLEAFMNGATLVLANEKIPNAKEMIDITHAYIMPAYLSTLDDNAMQILQKLNAINFGGDCIEANFLRRSIASGLNLYQQYGLTEASVYSTLHKIKSLDSKNCMGKSLSNVNFTIQDSDNYCTIGRRGICCISGIGLSRGYINDEKLTVAKYKANHRLLKEEAIMNYDRRFFITGDLTELNQKGQLKFFGRADNQLKIRGQFVNLADTEAILCTLPMIESCVITTQILKQSFSVLIAHVIVGEKFKTIEDSQLLKSIIAMLTEKIPSFMVPSYFFFVDKFPLNSNGKIDRERLQKVDQSIQRSTMLHDQYPPILNDLEKNVCRIFSDILGLPSINLDESFFAIGGDSLKALLAIQRIDDEFGIKISLKDIFRYQTFARILESLKVNGNIGMKLTQKQNFSTEQTYSSISNKFWLHENGIPLSFGQERLWFLQNYEQTTPLSYILEMKLHFQGMIFNKAFNIAINFLIRKHTIFRTVFRIDTMGSASQIILSLTESYITLFEKFIKHKANDFDLCDSPPLRIITNTQQNGMVLHLYMHHILTDGHSFNIISQDLLNAYHRLVNGEREILRSFPREILEDSYALFSYRQRRDYRLIREDVRQWIEQFRNLEALEVPTDFPRAKIFDTHGKIFTVELNIPQSEIDAFCDRYHCTVFIYLLTGYVLLMRAISGQRKFLIGTTSANRERKNLHTVGFFANSIPLNVNTEFSNLDELIDSLQTLCINSLQYQNIPFEVLIEQLNPKRDVSKAPLFQHSIVFHNASPSELPKIDGLSIEVEEIHSTEAKYDQTWFFQMINSKIRLQVEYCSALFYESTIKKYIAMYIMIAKNLLNGKQLGEISLLTNEERMNEQSRNHRFDTPRNSLGHLFIGQCEMTSDTEMMTWNDGDTTSGITYKEAFSFILHLSSVIQQSILCSNGTSIIADDCIAIICGDNFLSVLSIMAVQLIDGCYCPIDCNYPVRRIDFIRSDSRSILVLDCEETTVANDSNYLNINVVFRRWRLNAGINCYRKRFNRTSNSDLAYIIYTSGSTGKPKGVCIEQQSIVNVIEYTTRRYCLGALQRCYQFTKLTFDASLAYTFGAAINGATMCMRNENIQTMEDIRQNLPLDILHMTPVVLGTMTSADVKSLEKHVARWSIGGDKLTEQEMSKVIENGIPLIQVYGPTEVTVFQTTANMKAYSHTSTTIGPTISNMFGYIISDDGKQLPSSVKGEFFMVGENVARGYMNLSEMNEKLFVRNQFQTREEMIKDINVRGYKSGDIVKRSPSGEIVFYGRKDMQIKLNGYRIELNEIENALCQLDDISSCVAILQNGTIIVFFEGNNRRTEQECIEFLSQILPHYMIPARVIHVEKFPLNQNLKIDRNALRMIDEGNISTASGTLNDVETKILRIWCETLKKNRIGINENFFAIGGHSLLATTICFKIRETLHCECPIRYLFENQTVEKLARRLFIERKRVWRGSRRSDQWLSCGRRDRNGNSSKPAEVNVGIEMPVIRKRALVNEQRSKYTSPRPKSDNPSSLKYSEANEAMQKKLANTFSQGNIQPLPCCQLQIPLLHLYFNNPDGRYLKAYETGFRIQLRIVDLALLNKCINRMIMCHDALRSSFLTESKIYLQEVKSATESFIALRYRHEKSDLFVSNPFNSIPILSFLEEVDSRTNFVLRLSHVIIDARSMQIIAEELYAAYNGCKLLRRNANTYANFSKRYRRKIEDMKEENEKYWSNIITSIDRTILSTDKPRTTNRKSECGYVTKNLTSLNTIIEKLSRKHHCSNFVVMIAALSEILRRRLDQHSKIIIGCPIDMRDNPSESSVGFYICTVPIVIEAFQSASTVQLLLHRIAQQVENAIQHSTVSGEFFNSLYSDNELISCMIILDNFTIEQLSANSFFEVFDENSGHTKYELSAFITQQGADILIKFEYMLDLFYKESIIDLINEWAKCIKTFDTGTIIRNDHLEALCSADIPSISLSKLIENASLNSPQNKSLFNRQEQYNYLNMLEIIHQISNALQQCIICTIGEPLRSDTIIPIISTKSLHTMLICLSIVFIGAAYLPIDRTSPQNRIQQILEESKAAYYITEDDYNINNVVAILKGQLSEYVLKTSSTFKHRTLTDDLAYVIFTSGTTGKPKSVTIKQKAVVNLAQQSTYNFSMASSDCVYQFTNFIFDNSILEMIMAFSNTSALFIEERSFSTTKFLREIHDSNITHALLFPGLVEMFSQAEMAQLSQLRYWIVGAEKASERLISNALTNDVNVIQNYGPTETAAYALSKRMKAFDNANNLGKPIFNVIAMTRKYDGSKATPLTCGELLIGGIGLMRGYLNRVGENFEQYLCKDHNEMQLYASGDIVKPLRNGDVIFIGRQDEQVKIRGFRIELSEIEATICEINSIKQCKVIVKQEPIAILIAYIVAEDGKFILEENTIRQYCIQRLPYYMIPTYFIQIQQFPLTNNNKIDVCRLPPIEDIKKKQRKDEPKNIIEFQLWLLFKEILINEFISTVDDFFALGGNSLHAMRLAQRIVEEIGIEIEVRSIFQYRTIRQLAEKLNKTQKETKQNMNSIRRIEQQLPMINYNSIPLSFQQQQILFLCQTKQADYYSLLFMQNFDKSIDHRCLRMAFLRLILRQPTLRTIFSEANYETTQAILSGTECYFHSDIQSAIPSDMPTFLRWPSSISDDFICPLYCSITLTAEAYTVMLVLSHIISDAWSTRLIETDLSQLYDRIINGKFDDEKLAYTYAHYSVEQHAHKAHLTKLANECAQKLRNFLSDYQCIRGIFGKPSTTQITTIKCVQIDFRLNENTSQQVYQCCAKLSTTPFVIFVASFGLSVHKISGNRTLVIGAPIANRSKRTEKIVGNFLNNLLIVSISPKNNAKLWKYVRSINATVEEARRYECVPYCLINDILVRGMDRNIEALCQIYINCRYNLEDGKTNHLPSKQHEVPEVSSTQNRQDQIQVMRAQRGFPQQYAKCVHPIEVDIDLFDANFECSIRIRADIGSQEDAESLKKLTQHSLEEILRSAEAEMTSPNVAIKNTIASYSSSSERFALSPVEDNIDDRIETIGCHEENFLKVKLKDLWKQCLKVDEINDDDDFFLCGGNSLICLKLKRMIAEQIGLLIEIEEIFENKIFKNMLILVFAKENRSILRHENCLLKIFYGNLIDIHKLIVLFHPLVGGVTLPYAALIRKLTPLLKNITIVGIQHPNTFAFISNEPKLTQSIESLCSLYVNDIIALVRKANSCIFIGASMGAILAFECATQLWQKGHTVEEIINIDGGGQPSEMPSVTFEEHREQMHILLMRHTRGEHLKGRLKEAMIDNAWQLLRMAKNYRPKKRMEQRVYLLKVKGEELDDYGWHKIANTHMTTIPGTHEDMLSEENSAVIANVIAKIVCPSPMHNSAMFLESIANKTTD